MTLNASHSSVARNALGAVGRAKPLECVRLAGAFGRLDACESRSKLPHSKRVALARVIPRKPIPVFAPMASRHGAGILPAGRQDACPTLRPVENRDNIVELVSETP